eukprot:s347_g10.t1
MQSFYQAASPLGEGTFNDPPTDAGNKSSSFWYGSFRSKARQLPPIFSSLSGRGSDAVSIDKRIRDANSFSELLNIIKEHRVSAIDLSQKWQNVEIPAKVMLAELARASILKAADFNSTDVAKICWAFSKLDFIDGALTFWKEMANELTPQCLANIAVAFARQNLSYPELFGAMSRRSMTVIKDFADFHVTNLCWAQARAKQVDHELFNQLATHTVASRHVNRYSAEMAAQMCWAFAVAKVQHEELFSELTDFIARHASVFEVQYVANCAWSYASLGVRDDAAWHALARECKGGRLWRYPEDQLSAVCWAFARIRWHDAELFQDMLQVASQRLAEFQPQSLINFLSAVIVLREEDWLGGDKAMARHRQLRRPPRDRSPRRFQGDVGRTGRGCAGRAKIVRQETPSRGTCHGSATLGANEGVDDSRLEPDDPSLTAEAEGLSQGGKSQLRLQQPETLNILVGLLQKLDKLNQANLRDYFLKGYKGGGLFTHDGYERAADEWCWIHRRSGIKVWQDALDLTQSSGTGDVECLFHYTTQLGFRNITVPKKKAVEVFASLVTEGPTANAWWGQGVYSVRRAPDEWPDVATLVDNNYRNMHKRDVESKGREAADEEYASRVAYCIPILANSAMTYDVSIQQTPEMQNQACSICLLCPELIFAGFGAEMLRCRADATAEVLGPEDTFALLALARLTEVLVERGAFAEAESLTRRVLEATKRRCGPEHRNTFIAMGNWASAAMSLGKFSKAEALYRRCLAGQRAQFGADHPDMLTSMTNLSALLQQQGWLDEAEELQRKALAGREAQLGAHHPHTLSSINTLAAVLGKQGKLEEAEALYRRCLAGQREKFGANHPDTLTSMTNPSALLQQQGKLDEAEELQRKALMGLRSELMARLEGPTAGGGAPVLDPSHPLSSSLRSIGDPSLALGVPGARAEGPQEVPTRATIVNQRMIMKQLQQEFAEALIGKEEEIPPMPDLEASQERQQQLEEELRRLRRENGTLRTDLASSKEEAEAQKREAMALLAQVSDLKSDLDDVGFGHRDETKVLQKQIQELKEQSQQQSDELRQKTARLEEVEGRASHWESEAREALKVASSGKERLEELHKQEEKTRHKLEDTGVVLQESQSSWRAEQERLTQELQSKDGEIAKLKEVLAMHAPKEELQRWRSRCEDLQAQVEQANLANRKMQSAVGHMSNAACARGGDLQELHRRNLDLAHEYEKQKAELKRMDLEKRELKDQIENVDVSLKYFQGKYQDTMKDLKLQKEQSNEYAQSLASAQKLIRELQAENQRLQRGEQQQPAAFPGPAANGRVHGAYPVSQANLHASRHPSIQEAPNEVEIGRQSLLTQLDSGIFRS